VNADLYRQAILHDPQIADHFYCHDIESSEFSEFLQLYQKRPIVENAGGVRAQGAFFLWHFIRKVNPILVIESGVLKGQTTWIIEQAAPHAKVIALDPCLGKLQYRSPKAVYLSDDFAALPLDFRFEQPVVCFFDDHQDAFERVLQAHGKGIKYLIFDDNYPPGWDDSMQPHLTLRGCFEMKQHKEKAEALKKLIKRYYIAPQVVGKTAGGFICEQRACPYFFYLQAGEWPSIWQGLEKIRPEALENLPSIWQRPEDLPLKEMEIFAQDAPYYRWMTYVELFS